MESNEQRLTKLENTVRSLRDTLDGDGRSRLGLVDNFAAHKNSMERKWTVWETRDEQKKIYEGRLEKKTNLIIALGLFLLALMTLILTVVWHYGGTHQASNAMHDLFSFVMLK